MAALLAALMSTLEALINALSAVAVNDIWRPFLAPGRSDAFYLRVARYVAVAGYVIGLVEALEPVFPQGSETNPCPVAADDAPTHHPAGSPCFRATLRIRDRERKLIAKIEQALERVANQTFGVCEECGEDISEGRLKARPVTTMCIACKSRAEALERSRGM